METEKLCLNCEEPIDPKRVAALPNVKYCLGCQQVREENGQFQRSKIEITQDINGWQFDGVVEILKKGD